MRQHEDESGQTTIRDYLAILRRRKLIIIEMTVLVPAVALLVSMNQGKVFQASADMLIGSQDISTAVTGIPLPNAGTDPIRLVQTQARLARVDEVARRAVASAGVEGMTAKSLLEHSTVKGSPDSDFLTFTVRNGNADDAAALATAYARSYASYRLALDTSAIRRARRELQGQIVALRNSGDTKSALFASLVTKEQQLRTLELLQQGNTVVQPAERAQKVAPTPKRSLLLGAIVGFLLGVAAAFLWEALDRRVRSESEIEDRLALPILARLPEPPRRLRKEGRLAMLEEPTGVDAEAIRRLRTNVEFANLDGDARVIMVTSATEGEGKSTTIANLAVALARGGRKVVLVDLDLRKPIIGQYFGHRGPAGVTDVALGRVSLDAAAFRIPLEELSSTPGSGSSVVRQDRTPAPRSLTVLPAGLLPASPGEFVGTLALASLIEQLRDQYDLVLVDAPPICVVGDAMTMSARVDALVVVTRLGMLHKGRLEELRRELTASPARKLGIVVTGAEFGAAYGNAAYGYQSAPPRGERAPIS